MKGTRLLGNNRNLKVLLLALVAIVATGLALGGYAARSCARSIANTVNARFSIRGTQKPAVERGASSRSTTEHRDDQQAVAVPPCDRSPATRSASAPATPMVVAFRRRVLGPQLARPEGRRRAPDRPRGRQHQRARGAVLPGDRLEGRRPADRSGADAEGPAQGRSPAGHHAVPVRSGRLHPPDVVLRSTSSRRSRSSPPRSRPASASARSPAASGSTTSDRPEPSTRSAFARRLHGQGPGQLLQGQDRRDRPDRSRPARHPPRLDRSADVRGRDRGQRNRHRPARLPASAAPGWVNVVLIVLFGVAVPLPPCACARSCRSQIAVAHRRGVRDRRPAPLQRRHDRVVRVSDAGAGVERRRIARGPARDRGVRAHPRGRPVRALRPRGCRRPGAGQRRRAAARRRPARRHGHVHRPARLHLVLREAHAVPGDRRAQPLPERDVRRDPRQRRNPRRLHGRRDLRRVRGPARAARPRRPRAAHGP